MRWGGEGRREKMRLEEGRGEAGGTSPGWAGVEGIPCSSVGQARGFFQEKE